MNENLKFKCPRCGSPFLNKVTTGVTARKRLEAAQTNGSLFWSSTTITRSPSGFNCRTNFECAKCYFVLRIDGVAIDKAPDLVRYLKEQNSETS